MKIEIAKPKLGKSINEIKVGEVFHGFGGNERYYLKLNSLSGGQILVLDTNDIIDASVFDKEYKTFPARVVIG